MEPNRDFEARRAVDDGTVVIPVIQEQVIVNKEIVDTAKVHIRKRVIEEQASLNIPLIQEAYQVEHIPINKLVNEVPPIRQEGEVTIIPVVREVLVIEKHYELIEEIHVIRQRHEVPHVQEIMLKREQVDIERKPLDTKSE
jgi:uncharacterized protein (TIGR02271 family)